ncbi:MAG: hypothetical protein MUF20_11050 [Methylotetracoccus sp.]|nr:hypothetical protein [Methylotetracoccus sp.]
MLLKWFDTREVDALAEHMVSEFAERLPVADCEIAGRKAEVRLREAHETLLRQAREFASTQRLNIYKKSRLANRIKWALREAGYPKILTDEIAYELAAITALAGKG